MFINGIPITHYKENKMAIATKKTLHSCQIRSDAGTHGKFLGLIGADQMVDVLVNDPASPHDGYVKIMTKVPPINEKGTEDPDFLKNGGKPWVELANLVDLPGDDVGFFILEVNYRTKSAKVYPKPS